MSLKVIKRPAYLSPSSLMAAENNPNTFYLNRMAPNPTPYEPQGISAGVGSAFDALIKLEIIKDSPADQERVKKILIKDSRLDDKGKARLNGMMLIDVFKETQVEPQNHIEAWPMGKILFDKYKRNGYLLFRR